MLLALFRLLLRYESCSSPPELFSAMSLQLQQLLQ